ncbi:hypothetical protein [Chryseobacterium sp. MP_3.2]|uniref:hypothetical protein n=1 Tax=Chryseobacterium sp. MP_3.2 TaxID=3071712 RepID=UPI002DFB59B5|nr:hypothetical protein [Chryseobacterium sp. MP_3.2]
MKKFLLLFLAITAFACDSERDPIEEVEELGIVGIWKIEKTATISGADNKTVLSEELADACKKKGTYEFTADLKYLVTDYNSSVTGCVQGSLSTTYKYNETTKILTIGTTPSEVLILNANQLIVYVADDYDTNGDGIDDFLRYTYKR